jgi:hypothetical protein
VSEDFIVMGFEDSDVALSLPIALQDAAAAG